MASKVLKNSAIYVGLNFLQSSLSFFLLPLYTAYLSPADYGAVSVVNAINAFLVIFVGLSLNGAVVRLYYRYKQEPARVSRIWGTCVTITLLVCLGSLPLLVIFRNILLVPFAKGIPLDVLLVGVLSGLFGPLYLLLQKSYQARQEGRKYAINNLVFFFVNVLLTLSFVVVFKLKALGVVLATAVTNLGFFCVALRHFSKTVRFGIDREAARESLAYSVPLIPHALAGKLSATFDRLFLNGVADPGAVGLYSVGGQLSGAITTFAGSVNQAYSPWFFEQAEAKEDNGGAMLRVAYLLTDLYVFFAAALALLSRDIISLMASRSFSDAWRALPIQAFGAAFTGIYYVVSNSLFLDRTKVIPFVTVGTAGLNVVLNLLLIPRFSAMGAAAAAASTSLAQALATTVLGRRAFKLRYNIGRIFGAAGCCFAAASAAWIAPPGLVSLLVRLLVIGLLGVAYLAIHRRDLGLVAGLRKARATERGGAS